MLYAIPAKMSPVVELERRLALWEAVQFEELLLRIQLQAEARNQVLKNASASNVKAGAPKRARRLAKEGARSKAVSGLHGGVKQLSPEQQRHWAGKLLPRAVHPAPAVVGPAQEGIRPQAESQVSPNGQGSESPLKGIRFAPMTAPGPSGRRSEHVRELLSVRKRSVANRLLRLLGDAIRADLEGTFPSAARWILGSGVTFLEKPGKDAPRPIRAGEWLRKVIGKSLLLKHKDAIIKLMFELHQYGVNMQGGTEILFHARDTIEELARTGQLPPIAIIDVDLVNCFGSLEWDSILDAYAKLLPEALPWERWCTAQECDAVLPSGERTKINRGAGQGEPDGPLKASVTIGHAMQDCKSAWRSDMRDATVDVWLMDDGQLFTHPRHVDCVLQSLDRRLELTGATRGKSIDGSVRSMVRMFAPPGREQELAGWDSAYVRDTCNVLQSDDPVKVLGGICGTELQVQDAFKTLCTSVENLHKAIDQVQDPATEVVLKKSCADVSKIIYTLRLNGDRLITSEKLPEYTSVMRESLARSLGGDLIDTAWEQATCGKLGLGFRTAEEVALPAFIASRTAAAPAVRAIFGRLEAAGLAPAGALDAAYVARTTRAIQTLQDTFAIGAPQRDSVAAIVRDGLRAAEGWWANIAQGANSSPEPQSHRPAEASIATGEADDAIEERPGAPRIQKKLSALIDDSKLSALRARFIDAGSTEDVMRLDELDDEHQEHTWILGT
jgi:hypothetical protein